MRRRAGFRLPYVTSPTVTPNYPEYAALSAKASNGFIPPDWTSKLADVLARRGEDWASAVVGYDWRLGHHRANSVALVFLADEHDVVPPTPDWLREAITEREARATAARLAREEEARLAAEREQRLEAEWKALREAFPVEILAAHNYESHRHYENYVQGVDHILVLADLDCGRLRRKAKQALCETPSNARNLYFPNIELERWRRPECKTCIRMACRITGLEAPTLLGQR